MGRRNQKRAQKKREQSRARSGSPYRLIGASGDLVACYINRGWAEDGKASIYVVRRIPGGGYALGAYLVDLWCMGLKEAYGRLDLDYDEFLAQTQGPDAPLEIERIDLDTVRHLVAGGIRFAGQNGFRLPPRLERWTALLGGVGDPATADLSGFGLEGKLHYEGSLEDLRKRLIGSKAEEFLARPDVEFVLDDTDFSLVDDDDLALNETIEETRAQLLAGARQWCFANKVVPHPRLAEAIDVVFESIMQAAIDPDSAIEAPDSSDAQAQVSDMLALESAADRAQLMAALGQLQQFMHQFESPQAMLAACGLDDANDPPDDEDADDAERT